MSGEEVYLRWTLRDGNVATAQSITWSKKYRNFKSESVERHPGKLLVLLGKCYAGKAAGFLNKYSVRRPLAARYGGERCSQCREVKCVPSFIVFCGTVARRIFYLSLFFHFAKLV